MRIDDIGVKLSFRIPVGKPDKNGVIYTVDSIHNALQSMPTNLPIIYQDNESYSNGKVVGNTTDVFKDVVWDEDGCSVTIDGKIYYGGAEIIVNDIKDGVITDFRIISIGISK